MLTPHPIDLDEFLSSPNEPSCGACVVFIGKVRNHHEGKAVSYLYYESYAEMAEKMIQLIIDRAKKNHGVHSARVLHRTGKLGIGDIAVVVEVRSAHRKEAFNACCEIIDEIKRDVPIWKKEFYGDGGKAWVSCEHGSVPVE